MRQRTRAETAEVPRRRKKDMEESGSELRFLKTAGKKSHFVPQICGHTDPGKHEHEGFGIETGNIFHDLIQALAKAKEKRICEGLSALLQMKDPGPAVIHVQLRAEILLLSEGLHHPADRGKGEIEIRALEFFLGIGLRVGS